MSASLLLLAISIGLIGVCYEVCAPGSIWPGALGGLLATVAFYHALTSGFSFRQAATVWIAIPTAVVCVFLISTAIRGDRNKQFDGDERFRDEVGVAITAVHDEGKVRVRREDWDAKSEVPIAAGHEIVVRRRAGTVLYVSPR